MTPQQKIEKLKKHIAVLAADNADLISNAKIDRQSINEKDAEITRLKTDNEGLRLIKDDFIRHIDESRKKYQALQKQFATEMKIQETRLEAIKIYFDPVAEKGIDPESKTVARYITSVIQHQIEAVEKIIEGK